MIFVNEKGIRMVRLYGGLVITEEEYRHHLRCEKCGHDNYAEPQDSRLCSLGSCLEFYCLGCGYSNSSVGPVDCKCEVLRDRAHRRQRHIERDMRIRTRRAYRKDREL